MTTYTVQYEFPCEAPELHVSKCVHNRSITFLVPLNHPKAHNLGFADLLDAAALSGILVPFTTLNNRKNTVRKVLIMGGEKGKEAK